MYENDIQSVILTRMLNRVGVKYDKREGSIIWDALAPPSVEFENFYIILMSVLDEVFADTATRPYLIRRCAERGIEPKKASSAVVRGIFTPSSVEISLGHRFSHDDYNYFIKEKESDGVYLLQCETDGADVNDVTGQLIPIDYVKDLQTAYITDVVIPGENEEETESLRSRYMTSLQSEAFGGNRLDYKQKILSIPGVGGVKIYSGAEWNGGGTVKAVIINSLYEPADEVLVEEVQNEIDPNCLARTVNGEITKKQTLKDTEAGEVTEGGGSSDGSGEGVAAIGHFVTIVGAYNTTVNVSFLLRYKSGYSWDTVKSNVETKLKSYFSELNAEWQDLEDIGIVVRISQIESRLLSIPGIIDIQQTKLGTDKKDLAEENLEVDKDSLVSIGEINNE